MKKLLFLLLVSISTLAQAQVANPAKLITNDLDTLINGGTVISKIMVASPASSLSFQVKVTKVSGTVGGSVALQGSLDNVTFYAISGASNLSLTDVASQGTVWLLTGSGYSYYRLLSTGTGTMRATVKGYYLHRRTF